MNEYYEQKNVVDWFRLQYPDKLINGDVGGVWTKNYAQAIKNKCLGHSNGYPDLFIAEPKGKYHGLFIEMKSEKGRATPEQKRWVEELNKRKYYAVVCRGFYEAKNMIDDYFNGVCI
jgi:hypothetical protein